VKDWRKTIVGPDGTVADAIAALDRGALQICLVVTTDGMLAGTITDGDVRRGLLSGIPLDSPLSPIMRDAPLVAQIGDSPAHMLELMRRRDIRQLPVISSDGQIVDLVLIERLLAEAPRRDNLVVLMAGGMGTRLLPLTEDVPKPLLRVGSKPILETIIETFVSQGFHRFAITVNYKAEMIKAHFGNGQAWGIDISYLEERERLGTAGPLSLLPERPTLPVLVMNGDLLTKVDFPALLDFHAESGADATMCVREYDFQVPFGVVDIDNHRITGLVEKPVHSVFVNAGIYALSPSLLDLIPKETFFDMPDLFTAAISQGYATTAFPIREYWMDIGRLDDLERANNEFYFHFS
jgi:dTDP-glucose pyrophosphorylase